MPADLLVLSNLEQIRTPFFTEFFLTLTKLGEETVLLPVLCLLYWCLDKRLALFVSLNFFSGALINQILKITFCISRPWVREPGLNPVPEAIEEASGFSFPSGHTANAVSVFGSLLVWFRKRKWIALPMIVLTLLIGFSRMYLGVHTLQDVAVSLAVGFLWLLVSVRLFSYIEKNPEKDLHFLLFVLLVVLLSGAYLFLKSYPEGTDAALKADGMKTLGAITGAALGVFWDRRKIRFDVKAGIGANLLKLIAGLAVVLVLKSILKPWLNAIFGELFGSYLRYMLLLLWIFGFYPFLFAKVLKTDRRSDA